MSHDRAAGRLAAVRARIAAIEAGGRADSESLPFGMASVDACLPGGGLPLGRWHEVCASGMETETGVAPALFTALAAAPLARRGEAVWIVRRDDLWAPGLAGLTRPGVQRGYLSEVPTSAITPPGARNFIGFTPGGLMISQPRALMSLI